MLFRSFKNISFVNLHGSAHSFLLLCELVPAFVCEDCHPFVDRSSPIYNESIEQLNEFFMKLKDKHIEKWNLFYSR